MTMLSAVQTFVAPAAIPSPSQAVWNLGPFPIRAYAICIIIGIIVAVWWANKRYLARGGPEGAMVDIAFWAVPFGIVGGRIYHVISTPDPYFGEGGNPIKAFAIWDGGLGIWGAIALGGLGVWIGARRMGLRMTVLADSMAPTLLVAQAIGRLGNWFNQELFGGPTTLPWGLEISDAHLPAGYASGTLFHPTFLYEMLWNIAAAVLIVWLDRKFKMGFGRVFWLYVVFYTAGRLWIEKMRVDTAELIFGQRINVWVSIIVCLGALAMYIAITRKHKGRESSPYLDGREPQDSPDAGDGGLVEKAAGDAEVALASDASGPKNVAGAAGHADEGTAFEAGPPTTAQD